MESIFNKYGWEVIAYNQLHQGLINSTFVVNTHSGDYILQTVNHHIFTNPSAIDNNINLVGSYLKKKHPNYLFTHLVPTLQGKTLVEWEGQFYRAFHKIEGYALSLLENDQQAFEAANQFGQFTNLLRDFDANCLQTTLPDFHNLSLRYHQFLTALQNGNPQRIEQSKEAIHFLKLHQTYVVQYEKFIQHSDTHKRVTHHDTKISNVLFKQINGTEKAIAVIDLDTVMPGYFISDIGDMCRTYLCSVSEEEANLDLLSLDAQKWEALQKGYMSAMDAALSTFEKEHFFFAGQFMIYMQALRFLTDYLNMDLYYGAKYEGQNYVRALNQIRLLELYNQLGK
jgi:Ser/Thr protein kinase RdoA (MazF antagonist)